VGSKDGSSAWKLAGIDPSQALSVSLHSK
jgi:hypothetical protein